MHVEFETMKDFDFCFRYLDIFMYEERKEERQFVGW